jgi:WD40 repeat protein
VLARLSASLIKKLNECNFFQTAVATFKHHGAPVTTVEWHPKEGSVFASGGADDQIALWDLSVERDDGPDEETSVRVIIVENQKNIIFIFSTSLPNFCSFIKAKRMSRNCTGTLKCPASS